MRVVVVEDEEKARKLIVRLLHEVNPRIQVVGEAENAEIGMELIQKHLPDVAFVDIKMPGLSGLEMIRHLVQKNIQVEYVIISGYGEFSYAQEAINLGIKGYILKPISYNDIENVVHKTYTRLGEYPKWNNPIKVDKDMEVGELLANLEAKMPIVRNAVHYVMANISAQCRLSDVAKVLVVSPEYLSRNFHEEMGVTFMNFVKMVKMENACNLLKKTDMKVYEIAQSLGYENDKYFCNIFRDVMGMSPKKYRETMIEWKLNSGIKMRTIE